MIVYKFTKNRRIRSQYNQKVFLLASVVQNIFNCNFKNEERIVQISKLLSTCIAILEVFKTILTNWVMEKL